MRFADPAAVLYTVILVCVLALFYFWAEFRYKKASASFADPKLLPKLAAIYRTRVRLLRVSLNILAILLLGIAIARPQWGTFWKENRDKGIDILVAIDVSKSMLCQDVQPDRLSVAKRELKDFVKQSKTDRFALMAFSGDAFLSCPFTSDYGSFLLVLDNLKVGSVLRGGTSFYNLISEAQRSYKWADSKDKILLIMSDGGETEVEPAKAAELARTENIKIFSIGIGTEKGGPIPISDGKSAGELLKDAQGKVVITSLNETILKSLASESGGTYNRLMSDRSILEELYQKELVKFKKAQQAETFSKSFKERFQIPLAVAIIILCMDLLAAMVNKDE